MSMNYVTHFYILPHGFWLNIVNEKIEQEIFADMVHARLVVVFELLICNVINIFSSSVLFI